MTKGREEHPTDPGGPPAHGKTGAEHTPQAPGHGGLEAGPPTRRGLAPPPEPAKPRSVRDLAGRSEAPSSAASVEPEVVRFEVEGVCWTAQSMGGSIGPRGTAPASLLLLRFTRAGDEAVVSPQGGSARANAIAAAAPADAPPTASQPPAASPGGARTPAHETSAARTGEPPGDAQAWVPGRSLSDLSVEQLVEALRTARPWSESTGTRSFFGDIGGQRRR